MSEKLTEGERMTCVDEASTLLRRAAEPQPVGDSVKSAIGRAARRVGITFSRTQDIWYREARTVRADEMDAIRKAAAQRTKEQEARHEYRELMARLTTMESRLAALAKDTHQPLIDAHQQADSQSSTGNSALDR